MQNLRIQADKAVETAIFRYQTGDTSPEIAAALLAGAEKSRDLATRKKARFYLGRFFQRQYELSGDTGALTQCYRQYQLYTDAYQRERKDELLGDAFFYKALYYLEADKHLRRGDNRKNALRSLQQIDPGRDGRVYLDQIVWTKDRSYAVNYECASGPLRGSLTALLNKYAFIKVPDVFLNQILVELKQWCVNNKGGPYQAARR
jgi:hypothetical protein